MVCAYLACYIPLEFINDTLHIIVVTFCPSKILFWFCKGKIAKSENVKNSVSTQSKKVAFFFFFHNEELKQCLLLSCLMSKSLLKNRKKKYDVFFIWNLFPVIL